MHKPVVFSLLIAVLILASMPVSAQAQDVENLWHTIVTTPDLSTFAAILKATGDAALLDKASPMTVFAPTDAAFDTYFKSVGITKEDLLNNNSMMETIALHHILPGSITPAGLTSLILKNYKVATAIGPDMVAFSFNDKDGSVVEDVKILMGNTKTANGYLFHLDGVMPPKVEYKLPPKDDVNFVYTAIMRDEPNLKTIYALYLQVPALTEYIASHDLVTWFAATDDAWATMMSNDNLDYSHLVRQLALPRILLTSVVPYYYSLDMLRKLDGAFLGTAADNVLLPVIVKGNQVSIATRNIIKGDLLGSDFNVIHVIDGIIFPPKE